MFKVLFSLARTSTKLFFTSVLAVVIVIVIFATDADLLIRVQDFTNWFNQMIRTPSFLQDKQQLALYRTLVNEGFIFGIILMLVSRTIVELVAWLFGLVLKSDEKAE